MAKAASVERPYESMLIVPSDTPQKTIDEFVEKVKKVVSSTKGEFRGVQNWGRRRFTYPIQRQKEGVYLYLDFNGTNATVNELNTLFRVTDMILRHLTVDRKDVKTPPAVAPGEAVSATAAAPAAPATPSTEAPSAK